MTMNIYGVTVELTNETTIKAFTYWLDCEKRLEEAERNERQAYEDAFITGHGYDRNDFYDWEDEAYTRTIERDYAFNLMVG